MAGRGWERVMGVMPALPQAQETEHHVVPALIVAPVGATAPQMTDGVDAPGHVVDQEHPHQPAPQQRCDCRADAAAGLVSMGPTSVQEAMRRALAMGVDRAILVTDPALAGSDALATARVLSTVLKNEGAELIFCSTESTDGYTGMVPAGIAEFLGIPQLTFAREIKVEGSKAVVKRVVPTGYKTVEAPLPAVVTIASGSFEAIYPTMKGIMGAKKKPFTQFALKDLGIDAAQVGEAGARERVLSIGSAEARAAGQIVKDDGNAAQSIADFLQRYQLL